MKGVIGKAGADEHRHPDAFDIRRSSTGTIRRVRDGNKSPAEDCRAGRRPCSSPCSDGAETVLREPPGRTKSR